MPNLFRFLFAGVVAGGATMVARSYLEQKPPGAPALWERTNHRGETISLLAGPAVTAGMTAGALVGGAGVSGAIASLGGGAFGLHDDLAEDTSVRTKGLKGHLGALAQGELTTGGLKVLGIGATAFVSSCGLNLPRKGRNAFDIVVDTALIAGTANFINLLDLRPGRAIKFVGASATLLAMAGANATAGALVGTCAGIARNDLSEQDMLGDGGANAFGALLGHTFAARGSRPVRIVGLGAIVALTLASEKVSFSKVIAQTPWLNRIDMLGRRAPVTTESN